MTSASEVFALQLSRASGQANRFLRSRGIRGADRDDIVAAAMLWCWENRKNYSLTTTLETWFVNAIRHAHRDWMRGELRDGVTDIVENMGSKDSPEYTTILQDAVRVLEANMDQVDRAIVTMRLKDESYKAIAATLNADVATVKRRLARMRDTLPESAHVNTILRRAVTSPSPSSDDATGELSNIDKEIAALDFPPPSGKDCPPCWRCKWFEGYMPGTNIAVRMAITEAEVREAVRNTEAEKIRIAGEVRNGNL